MFTQIITTITAGTLTTVLGLAMLTGQAEMGTQTPSPSVTVAQVVGTGGSLNDEAAARVVAEAQAAEAARIEAERVEAERVAQEQAQAALEAAQAAENARIEQERAAAEQAAQEALAASQPVKSQVQIAQETVATLPNNAGITLSFDNPELVSTGAVWQTPDPTRASNIMVSSSRIEQYKTAHDVVVHEAFHVYQNRAIASMIPEYGDWFTARDALVIRLDAVYGPGKGIEYSADCGALSLGATWTHYTSQCAGTEHVTQALINGSGAW